MPLVERRGDRIAVVGARWSETEIVKEIAGSRWDERAKVWTVPLSWAAALQLRAGFGDQLVADPGLTAWSWDQWQRRVEPATALRGRLDRAEDDRYDPRLYDFQTSGAEFLTVAVERAPDDPPGGALLGDSMGLGKTAQVYAALEKLLRVVPPENVFPALVVCPTSVKLGWDVQATLWESRAHVYVVTGTAAKRRQILAAAREDPLALVVVNIEAVRLLSRLAPYGSTRLASCRQCNPKHGEETLTVARCEVHRKELNGFGFRTVVLDEAHRIKDPTSKQTRAVWAVGHDPSVLRRWAMTGTAIADHLGDLWAILHFLTPHEFPSKTQFVERYAQRAWNPYGGLDIVGVRPEHREEFFKLLDTRFRRVPKALVLDQLPSVVRSVRWVEMVPKQSKAYRDMEERLMTRLSDGSLLVAPNNLVNAARLLQLSSSYCEVDREERTIPVGSRCGCAVRTDLQEYEEHVRGCAYRGRCRCHALNRDRHVEDCPHRWRLVVTPTEPSPKLDSMEEAFDELGGRPVVIVAMHRKLIDLAAKRFEKRGVPHGLITGEVSEGERQRVLHRFREGKIQVVLMTIDAGGTGLDGLQVADTLFCLQRSWSMVNNLQVDDRVHRIGSEVHSSVHVVEFVTQGSIESEKQYPRLAAKYHRLEEIQRDRARLLAAGVQPGELFELDRLQRAETGDLGEDPAPTGEEFEESTRELAERYGIHGVTDEEEPA